MRYFVLAADYDGTLAHDGRVDERTVDGLRRVKESGRKLVLVSGRELEDLQSVFEHFELFDLMVLENGALLYWPQTGEEKIIAEPPPASFIERLRERGVGRVQQGRVIVATWRPWEIVTLETIREQGLGLEIIFNKDAVMVLPSGVNKATGLRAALKELGLSSHNVVAVGDAENDHAFFSICGICAAMSNSVPKLKERADFVTEGHHGAGVVEVIDELISTDFRARARGLPRRQITIGHRADGRPVKVPPMECLLIVGSSESAKRSALSPILTTLIDAEYQCCVIDPEGNYESVEKLVSIGTPEQSPPVKDVIDLLRKPKAQVGVNMLAVPGPERPAYFAKVAGEIAGLRDHTGRPHYIVIDRAHHVAPRESSAAARVDAIEDGLVIATVHPSRVSPALLDRASLVLGVGPDAADLLRRTARALESPEPRLEGVAATTEGEALLWDRGTGETFVVRTPAPAKERVKARRKPFEGELEPERSFYFRGPESKLNLRAQTLRLFLQIGGGVDLETWEYHLRRGDYARWLENVTGDQSLAEEVRSLQQLNGDVGALRERLERSVQERFVL